jgi:dolichol-phosphate mannosyltransferase
LKILLIIPTYNEILNIERLINDVLIKKKNIDILVIDDNSPDGTKDIVNGIINESHSNRLFLLERPGKMGLASAYITGFKWGIERGYDAFIEMDADFSHNPKYLAEMTALADEYDCVIGSRYVKDGGVSGWGFIRKFISGGGSLYSRLILGIRIKDLTGGYNLWKKNVLEKIKLDEIISNGYLFQIEMKYRAFKNGFKIIEMPIIFEDRIHGKSKMSKKIFLEAVIKIWSLKFIKFQKK